MRRGEFLGTSLNFASAPLAGCTSSLPGSRTPTEIYQNPVFEPVFADPSVVRTPDGTLTAELAASTVAAFSVQ